QTHAENRSANQPLLLEPRQQNKNQKNKARQCHSGKRSETDWQILQRLIKPQKLRAGPREIISRHVDNGWPKRRAIFQRPQREQQKHQATSDSVTRSKHLSTKHSPNNNRDQAGRNHEDMKSKEARERYRRNITPAE